MESALQTAAQNDQRIFSLLNDIAELHDRLKLSYEEAKDECERMVEIKEHFRQTRDRLTETWVNFHREYVPGGDRRPRPSSQAQETLRQLTPRELEVLRLIADGLSTKEIAAHLGISFKTAVSHRSHILEKTSCHESATLVRIAIRAGVVK